jgi:hypothetical protein
MESFAANTTPLTQQPDGRSLYARFAVLLVLVIWIADARGYCNQQSERTHAERFAPRAEKIGSAEQKAQARGAGKIAF